MTLSSDDAAAVLDDIERVLARTRRALVAAHVADHLIVWGLVWISSFGATYATTWPEGWIWGPTVIVGISLSVLVGLRSRRTVESRDSLRLFWFLVVLVAFAAVWAVILHPFNARNFGAYIGTVFMFAYVAGGLWFGRFFVLLGSGVAATALAGVLLIPSHLDLLMAVAGGGSLLASGVYIRRTWT